MGKDERKDLKIYGSGISNGGTFDKISIMGEGMIHGNVECSNLKVYGEGQLDGNVKTTDYVSIKGETIVEGYLNTRRLKVQGEIEVGDKLCADKAKIQGSVMTGGNLNAEILNIEGGFTVDGMLNADTLKINLYWPSEVNEIGGSEIKITRNSKLSFLGIKNRIIAEGKNKVTCNLIEGDNIYLENTIASIVRGNNVTIGPGCKIELVEYKNDLKMDDEVKVNTHMKI
ncbi:MAG: polymer-forming cytoskeletal protein [Methanobacterium sp.]|mgnify:CR=1 FL=1|jgi:cytoskeletal protein CcmA (bactofilin family)|nr:polymer-forming cytoskeletal protein [Methanobacterium sp.]